MDCWNNKTVLVTGAGGFIGSHLVTHLQKQGHEVIGMDSRKSTRREVPCELIIHNLETPIPIKNDFDRLFKICRSILGDGFRKSLNIIGEIADLDKKKIKSGTKVLDWTVPNEWNIKDAYIISPTGKKIADFKINNLHVVNYSCPVNKTLNLDE